MTTDNKALNCCGNTPVASPQGEQKVTRDGDLILRQSGPWSDSVHALLKHLAQHSFSGAPRVLGTGYDEQGREVLSYLAGEIVHPRLYTDEAMAAVDALFLRETCTERSKLVMNKKLKPTPQFASETEERAYWETHDSSEHIDWKNAKRMMMPNLKLSTTSISLRLPDNLLAHIKTVANRMDVPYQSLMKVWLSEKLAEAESH